MTAVDVLDVVGIVLIILKLCGIIAASWWLVLLPIYAPILFILAVMLLSGRGGKTAKPKWEHEQWIKKKKNEPAN